jgi:hypothetical protein
VPQATVSKLPNYCAVRHVQKSLGRKNLEQIKGQTNKNPQKTRRMWEKMFRHTHGLNVVLKVDDQNNLVK